MERSSRVGLSGTAFGTKGDPRVRPEMPGNPVHVLRRALFDPNCQVVDFAGEHLFGSRQHVGSRRVLRVNCDDMLGNGEEPPRSRVAQPAVGDEMGDFHLLACQAPLLLVVERRAWALMPAQGVPTWHKHCAAHIRSPAELDVLRAPLRERLIETSHVPEEVRGHAEVAAGDCAEDVVGAGFQVVRAGHPAFYPLGALDGSPAEQVTEASGSHPDGLGRDAVHVNMPAEPEGEQVAGCMVPAGVLCQPTGFGHHVAVQEDEDLAIGGPGAVVTGAGKPEAEVFLVHDLHR